MKYTYTPRSALQWGYRRYQSSDGLPSKMSTNLSAMLHEVPFQLFVAISPTYQMSVPHLENIVANLVEAAERHFRAPLTYTVGYETWPVVNAHLCIASSASLDVSWIEAYLKGAVGRPPEIDVQSFDSMQDGLPYALKAADDPDGEWDIVNMDYYLPGKLNRKKRKRLARHQERVALQAA